jgi:hypothetical protein
MLRSRILVAAFLFFAFAFAAARPAAACSVCRCGDPTFNALGTQIFERGAFRLAVDFERLEKSQGIFEHEEEHHGDGARGRAAGLVAAPLPHEGHEHATTEELLEDRLVATLSYAPTERLEIVGRLPWSQREIAAGDEVSDADGMGDPELYAMFRLWASDWEAGMGLRSWVSLVSGVKTDWGENDQTEDGERIDEHLQSGTGSVDPFVGLSAVRLFDARSTLYGSATWREPGRNDFGYRYGEALLLNVGYERKLGSRFDATVEINFRDAAGDEVDAHGVVDPNTGGAIAFVTPRLLIDLGRNWVARISAQIPAWEDLDGIQDEKAVVNLGLTTQF